MNKCWIFFTHNMINVNNLTAMDQLFKELSYSQQEDSSWLSKLNANIATPPQLNVGNTEISNEIQKNDTSEIDINSTDIIPLLTESTILTQSIMETNLGYPKGCSFCFEGFNGVKDYDRLKKISLIVLVTLMERD